MEKIRNLAYRVAANFPFRAPISDLPSNLLQTFHFSFSLYHFLGIVSPRVLGYLAPYIGWLSGSLTLKTSFHEKIYKLAFATGIGNTARSHVYICFRAGTRSQAVCAAPDFYA